VLAHARSPPPRVLAHARSPPPRARPCPLAAACLPTPARRSDARGWPGQGGGGDARGWSPRSSGAAVLNSRTISGRSRG
jgi:hypothetical protein